MKILHLLSGGGIGGIEMLCRDIAVLSTDSHEFCFLYNGGIIADEMEQSQTVIHRYYKKNIFMRLWNLRHLVKKQKYDVVIVHHEGIGIYTFYLMLCRCFKNTKFIKYLHCSFEEKYFYTGNKLKDNFHYRILKKTLEHSNHLIAVSEFVKNSYQDEFGLDNKKASVVYNGIKLETWDAPILAETFKEKQIHLLYIGRLVEVKGIHILINAVQKLILQGNQVELEVLGDGPERKKCEQLTADLGLEEKVFFRGYQLNKKPYYDTAQIFVYPSIWQEAFGISIVEAQAVGLICVASRVGGIPEIISDGKDGFLFEKGNADDLTNALQNAIEMCESSKYGEMQKAAHQNAAKFSIQQTVDKLHEICARIVEE